MPSGKTILIVDDQPDVRHSLGLLLRLVGYDVALAADGRAALEYLRSHPPPCLIVLDLRMPGMSGWQFRDEQRRDPALAAIPVVVSSAEMETGGAEALGSVAAFVPKASDPFAMVELVQRHCG